MDEDEDTLAAEAIIGDEAEAFMHSDLGRTILGIADQEAQDALAQLKSAQPTDTEKIRSLQNIIWRSEQFKGWLADLIDRGVQALRVIQHEEETNE
jgi:hypothetical protein